MPLAIRKAPREAMTIAGPPSSAVGLRCHRSSLGGATNRSPLAMRRAKGVSATDRTALKAKARKIRRVSGCDTVVIGDTIDRLDQPGPRLEAQERPDLGNVGDAARHVLEAGVVGLVVGHENDVGIALQLLLDQLRQIENRDLVLRSDVEDLAVRGRGGDEPLERPDHVADVAEAARLGTVAVDRD